jgi:hypothetical protein
MVLSALNRVPPRRSSSASGRFDLVLVAGLSASGFALRRVLSNFPAMRVVYVDASLRRTGIEWPPNATGLAFADSDSGYLAGFLSGFVSAATRDATASAADGVGRRRHPDPERDGACSGVRPRRPGRAARSGHARPDAQEGRAAAHS